jgi:hypothetical protein
VALERRAGNLYYYRSVRDGERVRKVYVGAGEVARISHESDVLVRAGQEAERQRLEALSAPVLELSEASEVLARAHLIAAGCHRHKGEWRHARGEARGERQDEARNS